jgi:peptidoglycan/LPS O-acetylase OafA/YrhL
MFLNRARRVTTDGRWIPEIDGLRFLAIASVVLHHLNDELHYRSGRVLAIDAHSQFLNTMLIHGDRGVRLFFIISGFVLALPFARHFLAGDKPVSLRKYFLRRVTRLEPPYFAALLICLAMVAFRYHHLGAAVLESTAASFFYLHDLLLGPHGRIDVVTWSLEVEIQFYVLAPLFMYAFALRHKIGRRVLLATGILLISLAQLPFAGSPRFTISILYYAQFFLTGLLLADIYVVDGRRLKSSIAWDFLGAAALIAMFALPTSFFVSQIVMPWAMTLIWFAALRSILLQKVFSNQWIAVIGGMCYSIYLLHFMFIAAIFRVTRHLIFHRLDYLGNFAIQILVTAIPAVALTMIFFFAIERPCMDPRWPQKLRLWLRNKFGSGEPAPAEENAA